MILLGDLTEQRRQQYSDGEWPGTPALENTKPLPFTPTEALIFRIWRRLAPARMGGGMDAGNIDWRALQELMDRESIRDSAMREFIESAVYATDHAAKDQAAKIAKANAGRTL